MRKVSLLLFLFTITGLIKADDYFSLSGNVKSAITKQDLTDAIVIFLDKEGNPKDTVKANQGLRFNGEGVDTTAYFYYKIPKVDSLYVFDVMCEGFETVRKTYQVDKIGKRETGREIPVIYLRRQAIQLKEVTVTASKVKFYNRGDTLVYDATAFQLAEGSMLDALIAQLPGVELSTDGQIKVNGQFVESLLLDGKQFFDGDNNLMLENIAAYTVKDIQVYDGVSKKDKAIGQEMNKVLTMDVRLKKEYNIGWMVNAQGGYGTENRNLGRLFVAWFNPEWRVSLVGNINNLNDNRQPGRNDTWTPEEMPSGRQKNATIGLQYNYETPDSKKMAEGDLSFSRSISDLETRTDRTNFLSGGNTYEKSFSNSHLKSTALRTSHWMMFGGDKFSFSGYAMANYSNQKNSSSSLSGVFLENQDTISYAFLDGIYSTCNQKLLETVINRSKTMTDGWNKSVNIYVGPSVSYKIPKTNDGLSVNFNFSYFSTKDELWKDYDVNYGSEYQNPEKLRQYFDNTPNHKMSFGGSGRYHLDVSNSNMGLDLFLNYKFNHTDEVKDSYMYALDRLNDMGVYGILPSGYLASFDPNNSYKSQLWTNEHTFNPMIYLNKMFGEKVFLFFIFNPDLTLEHRRFHYWRNEQEYRLSKTNAYLAFYNRYTGRVTLDFTVHKEEGQNWPDFSNHLIYEYVMNPTLPDMFDMVDVVNDSDPLNVYYGNPDLKPSVYYKHKFIWELTPYRKNLYNQVSFSYDYTVNALTRGYTYDTATGIRFNRMYNVSGNHSLALSDQVMWEFGNSKQFTLSSYTEANWSQYSDMIGVDMESPALSKVRNRILTENFKFSWKVGKANLGLRCDLSNRYTTSRQDGFSALNAWHITSGATAQVNLPAGFSVNTDFMLYTRNGYGVEYLDTTDPVWNIRLSYSPPKNTGWLFMLDGYDMLHTLSNVSYAVNAAGRTVSYTNVLPRYFLLSIQYRLNIQPKKR